MSRCSWLWDARSPAKAPLVGTIRDGMSGGPLAGAEVRIGEFGLASTTDSAGRYRLVVPGGRFQLQVRKIGFVSQVRTLTVVVADPIMLDITLLPAPQELPEVVAVAARREQQLAGFHGRMKEGWGRFLAEDLLRKSEHRTLSSLIRQRAAGVHVTSRSGRAIALGRSRCPMAIWQDGLPVYMPSGSALGGSAAASPPPDLDQWHVSDLQGVEIYNGPSQVPWEFGITGTGCGLILLWTRYR